VCVERGVTPAAVLGVMQCSGAGARPCCWCLGWSGRRVCCCQPLWSLLLPLLLPLVLNAQGAAAGRCCFLL
jgi:hypothetical protein